MRKKKFAQAMGLIGAIVAIVAIALLIQSAHGRPTRTEIDSDNPDSLITWFTLTDAE